MAITFLGADIARDPGGGTPSTSITTTLAQNDIIVLFGQLTQLTAAGAAGVTTTGYTQLVQFDSATLRNMWAGYKIMGASPDTTITCKGAGGSVRAAYVAMYFRGVDTGTPIDATTTTNVGAGAPNGPAITTVTNNAAVISAACSVNDTTISAPTGYGDLQQANQTAGGATTAGAWKTVATAGSENPGAYGTWTSADNCAATIALRPAATLIPTMYYYAMLAGINL